MDLFTPKGIADWVWYAVPLLLTLYLRGWLSIFLLAGIVSILSVAGFFLSPPGVDPQVAGISRAMGIGVLWVIAAVVSERHRAQLARDRTLRQLAQTNLVLGALTKVTADVTNDLSLEQLLRSLLRRLGEIMRADAAVLMLKDDGRFCFRASEGLDEPADIEGSPHFGINLAETISGTLRPLHIPDVSAAPQVDDPFLRQRSVGSLLGAALRQGGAVIGVVYVGWCETRLRQEAECQLLESIVERCAMAIHNAQLFEQLKRSEARYHQLVESWPDAVHLVQNDRILFSNAAGLRLLAVADSREILGKSLTKLVCGEVQAAVPGEVGSGRSERRAALWFERQLVRENGQRLEVEYAAIPLADAADAAVLVVLRDITARKRLEQQERQEQKLEAVGRLAEGVAHAFNNLLHAILLNLPAVLGQLSSQSNLRQNLEEIQACAQRPAELTRHLLAVARKGTLAPKLIDLNATLQGRLKILGRLMGENIALSWLPAESLWWVKIDPEQLDQILTNLCLNARDAMTGNGKVTLETANVSIDETHCASHAEVVPGDYVMLAVSDTGRGMERAVMSHLFEPFFTTKSVDQGSGLGLATVYGMVKQNRGYVIVHSEPGQGSTFKVYFPRHRREGHAEPAASRQPPPSRGHETILLVEDEPAVLELSQRTLERLGYKVVAAATAAEALRLAEDPKNHHATIHLLLTDVIMPEINGRELAKRLSTHFPHLQCLFMTGSTANVIANHDLPEAGIHFLQKPFSATDLSAKVRSILGQGPGENAAESLAQQ